MSEEQQGESGFINIALDKDSVKYETNLPMQDLVFWIEAVKQMALDQALNKPNV